jgi:hypothetical protein
MNTFKNQLPNNNNDVIKKNTDVINNNPQKNAIIFFTFRPHNDIFDFGRLLFNKNYDVYICINDNNYDISSFNIKNINIIKLNNNLVSKAGYKGTNACHVPISSRDKALYYINRICKRKYRYTWFIEEDVFIPTVNTIKNIDEKYDYGDYMCTYYGYIYEKESDKIKYKLNDSTKSWSLKFKGKYDFPDSGAFMWWVKNPWGHKKCGGDIYNLPYLKGMTNAIRVSPKFLDKIDEIATKHGNLFFDEIFFPTMCIHENLEMVNPIELSPITWLGKYNPDVPYVNGCMYWGLNNLRKDYLFHPIKDIESHKKLRKRLDQKKIIRRGIK